MISSIPHHPINNNFLTFTLNWTSLSWNHREKQKNAIFTHYRPYIVRWHVTSPIYSQYFKIDSPKMEFSLCFVLCALSFNSQEKINSSIHFSKFRFLAFGKSGKMTFNCISKMWRKRNQNCENCGNYGKQKFRNNQFQKYSIELISAYRVFYSA